MPAKSPEKLNKNTPPAKHIMLHISIKDLGKDFLRSFLSGER